MLLIVAVTAQPGRCPGPRQMAGILESTIIIRFLVFLNISPLRAKLFGDNHLSRGYADLTHPVRPCLTSRPLHKWRGRDLKEWRYAPFDSPRATIFSPFQGSDQAST